MAAIDLRVTILDPALDPAAAMWGDATDGWQPPALDWLGTLSAAAVPVRAIDRPEDDDGRGLLLVPEPDAFADEVERAAGAGRPVLTGPPPDGAPQRLAAVRDALGALVRPDLRGVLVLRLDDPGASVRRLLRPWRHDDVAPGAWEAMWSYLRAWDGRVSLFCCPGWVEPDGTVRESREVVPGEWAELDAAVAGGLADLECHGFTHVDPDLGEWLRAPDRLDEPGWFRELWPPLRAEQPSWEEQAERIAQWQARCGDATTLVAPGEGWGDQTLEAARRRGLRLFCSWGICRLDFPVPTWSRGVGSPYLDEADPRWFASGLPVVGYWHDRDMAVHGPEWVPRWLDRWREAGARRLWAFADLARVLATPVEARLEDDGEIRVLRAPAAPLLEERRLTPG
jgi:hypothetical protein